MILNLKTVVVAFMAAGLLGACGGGDAAESNGSGLKVIATTTQIGALTREVAGDHIELTVLLTAGADAHDYEPNPQAVKRIGEAGLVLRNGIGLDEWLDDTLKSAGGAKRIVTVTNGVAVRMAGTEGGEGAEEHAEDKEGHEHEGEDPHVWHNPDNAKIMVDNIVAALSEADGANATTFKANGDAYKEKLDAVDAEIRKLIAEIPAESRKMVTNHDAFGYFIDRYGLTFVGAVIPSSNKDAQASAKELAELQDLIKRENVKVIFAEEEVDPKVARELAKDTNVTIVEGLFADSLGKKGSGADTIDGMLLFNARKIVEALK
jgi:zinc/manganese transport system substrate-binding protein